VLANDVVDDALVRCERAEALCLIWARASSAASRRMSSVMRSRFSRSALPAAVRRIPIARPASPAAASAIR
jgi:hypothetical protein